VVVDPDNVLSSTEHLLGLPHFQTTRLSQSQCLAGGALQVRPDLIVVADGKCGLTGRPLCQALRGHPQLAAKPIILLVNSSSVEARVSGLEAGADDCLSEPIDPKELVALI